MPDATPRPDDFVADLLEAASRPGVESWHRSAWVDQVVRQFKTMASSGREMLQAQGLVTSHREGAATALDCVGTHNAGFWKRFEHLAHGETNNEGIQSLEDMARTCGALLAICAVDSYDDLRDSTPSHVEDALRDQVDQLRDEIIRLETRLASKTRRRGGHTKTRRITAAMRAEVYERDGHACLICGATDRLSIDHIVPFSQGGPCEVDNFQTLCLPCNVKKRDTFFDLGATA